MIKGDRERGGKGEKEGGKKKSISVPQSAKGSDSPPPICRAADCPCLALENNTFFRGKLFFYFGGT